MTASSAAIASKLCGRWRWHQDIKGVCAFLITQSKIPGISIDKKAAEAAYYLHFLTFVLVYCCNAWQDPSNWMQFIHPYSRLRQARLYIQRWGPSPMLWIKSFHFVFVVCWLVLVAAAVDQVRHGHVWYCWFNEFPTLVLIMVVILVVVKPS
jgi:hypothetical protein